MMDIIKIISGKIKNLQRANLQEADLRGANLREAKYGNFKIVEPPIQVTLKYSIIIFKAEGYIQVGCHLKTIAEWKNITTFDDQQFLDEWKEKILSFAQ